MTDQDGAYYPYFRLRPAGLYRRRSQGVNFFKSIHHSGFMTFLIRSPHSIIHRLLISVEMLSGIFRRNTYHIILVNLFEQKPEYILLACANGQYIFCADNGLMDMILPAKPEKLIGLPLDKNEIKNTLYCIRQIGQAIRAIETGVLPETLGNPEINYIQKNDLRPLLGDNYIEGQIIFIDKFENVIVNITRDEFEAQRKGRSFRIVFKRNEIIDRISESYADVATGRKTGHF